MSLTPKGPAVAYDEHDPYCIEADLCGGCDRAVCICWVIAKVRADERERVAAKIERAPEAHILPERLLRGHRSRHAHRRGCLTQRDPYVTLKCHAIGMPEADEPSPTVAPVGGASC